jgi:DNA-binding PadR family transcriptional regulator
MQEHRLTSTSYIVLGLLEQLGEASPYDLKQTVAQSVGNFWSVPHSQLYREAERLATDGYVSGRREETPGGRPRTIYRLTSRGRRALAAWRKTTNAEDLPQLRDPGLLKLFFGADPRELARARRDAHARKLAEYEQLHELDSGDDPRGPWLALEAGLRHEREWVRFWSKLAGD